MPFAIEPFLYYECIRLCLFFMNDVVIHICENIILVFFCILFDEIWHRNMKSKALSQGPTLDRAPLLQSPVHGSCAVCM